MVRRSGRNRGSALAWAVCLLLVLTVMIAGMAGIASAFQRRGAREYSESQAYLAATGAVEAVLSLLDGALAEIPFEGTPVGNVGVVPSESEIWQQIAARFPLLPTDLGSRLELTDFSLGNMQADSAEGYIERVSRSQWRVSVTAVCGGVPYTASALLELVVTPAGEYREQQTAEDVLLTEIFHANVIENLVLPGESTLSAPGGALYIGKIAAPGDTDAARAIEPDGALFTRETLASPSLPGASRSIFPAAGGEVAVYGGARFSGEMPGFGDIFLPGRALTETDASITPALYEPDPYALCSVRGEISLNLLELWDYGQLYLFLENATALTLTGPSPGMSVYIHCPVGSKVIIEDGVSFIGAVVADTLELRGSAEIRYAEPEMRSTRIKTGISTALIYPAGAFDYKWSFVRYE